MLFFFRNTSPLRRVLLGSLSFLLLISCKEAPKQEDPPQEKIPALTKIFAPQAFQLDDPSNVMLVISIAGENLDINLTSGIPINIEVSDIEGMPVKVQQVNDITLQDVAMNNADVGFLLTGISSSTQLKFCAHVEGVEGNVCSAVDVAVAAPDAVTLRNIDTIRSIVNRLYPGIECRCDTGYIRLLPTESSHGTLGSFSDSIGGGNYGSYNNGNVNTHRTISSVFKFEPHFEIEIINEPTKPGTMSDADWSKISALFPYLCPEGQKLNSSYIFFAGTPSEIIDTLEDSSGNKYPFDTTGGAAMDWDGHGYIAPNNFANPNQGTGPLKAHDGNVIHWLDMPGYPNVNSTAVSGAIPIKLKYFFHMFVHGSTGNPDDNCDCYMAIESGIVDASGAAQPARVIKGPICQ